MTLHTTAALAEHLAKQDPFEVQREQRETANKSHPIERTEHGNRRD